MACRGGACGTALAAMVRSAGCQDCISGASGTCAMTKDQDEVLLQVDSFFTMQNTFVMIAYPS